MGVTAAPEETAIMHLEKQSSDTDALMRTCTEACLCCLPAEAFRCCHRYKLRADFALCSTLADATGCDELLICALLFAPCCEYVMMTIAQSTQQLQQRKGYHLLLQLSSRCVHSRCGTQQDMDHFTDALASFLLMFKALLPLVFACCMTADQAPNCQHTATTLR